MKKQWGGLLTFVLIAVLSLPALGQQQAPAQAPAGDASAPAQAPAAAPSTPQPLPNPSMTAPLSTAAPPHTFNAGPFGTVAITGILSGMGLVQNNWIPGIDNKQTHWDRQQCSDLSPKDERLVPVLPARWRLQPTGSGRAIHQDE